MTARERKLAFILAFVILPFGVLFFGNFLFWQPWQRLRGELARAEGAKKQALDDIKKEKEYLKALDRLNPKVARWEKLSLPDRPVTASEGQGVREAHLQGVKSNYQDWLETILVRSARLRKKTFEGKVERSGVPIFSKNQPIYTVLHFTFIGSGSLDSVVKAVYEIERTPLLHQIKKLNLKSLATGTGGNGSDLEVTLEVEALVVSGADAELAKPAEKAYARGEDGKLLIGPDNDYIRLAPQKTVALDSKGKLLLGPDRKPIEVPLNQTVALDGNGKVLLHNGKPVLTPLNKTALLDPAGKLVLEGKQPRIVEDNKPVPGTIKAARALLATRVKRDGIMPIFTRKKASAEESEKPPQILATLDRRYPQIATKNIFKRPQETSSDIPPLGGGEPQGRGEPRDQVLAKVYLTGFIGGEGSHFGCLVALLRDQAKNDRKREQVYYLTDRVPKTSRHLDGIKVLEEAIKKADAAAKPILQAELEREKKLTPVQKVEITDFENKVVTELKVVKLLDTDSGREIIAFSEGKYYRIKEGQNLLEGLKQAVPESEVAKLGLGGDRDEVFRKVVLKELTFSQERKIWEAKLENGVTGEKKIMANDPNDLLNADETWRVKDETGGDLWSMTAVLIDKERMIFKAEDKYYQIKVGQNLFDVRAKPMSDDEVKKFKGP